VFFCRLAALAAALALVFVLPVMAASSLFAAACTFPASLGLALAGALVIGAESSSFAAAVALALSCTFIGVLAAGASLSLFAATFTPAPNFALFLSFVLGFTATFSSGAT
jgi:hypothetical protein